MLKVLIADDERKVGNLVKTLIEWERLGLAYMGLAQDGLTAYRKICEEEPDIVITDIRMPELTGLDLIKRVTEEGRKVHFIVISGYKYFEYAQQSIRYGVEDYLLKPIDEVELNRILEKICSTEQSKEKAMKKADSMEQTIKGSRQVLHREFLSKIRQEQALSLSEINQNYGLNFENGLFRVISFKVDRSLKKELNVEQLGLIVKKLADIIENGTRDKVTDIAITQQKNAFVTAVINYSSDKKEENGGVVEQIFTQGMDYLSGFEHYGLTMGVSGEYNDFLLLRYGVEAAKEAVYQRILGFVGGRIDASSINQASSLCAERLCREYGPEVFRQVEVAKYDDMRSAVRQTFAEARKEHAFAGEYYELSWLLLKDYLWRKPVGGDDGKQKSLEQWEEIINNCKSILQLETVTEKLIEEDWSAELKSNREKERKPVFLAVEYIKKNYGKKLGLEELAEQSGFNMNYFSELFKKETGKNFTAFVTEVRMEEAKKLLRDTHFTVYEVADKVGYKDSKFFSQQFVKTVGIKPVEYRKLYY